MRLTRRAILAAPLFSAAGRAQAMPGWPRHVEDALGRGVFLPAPPQRIVAIFASNVELLAALGMVPRIVGIEAYTRFPPEVVGKPLVGGRLGFSAEAIARLGADLVVMTPARQAAGTLLDPLGRAGIPVLVVEHRDVPQVFANIALLAEATGTEAEAAVLLEGLRARLAAVAARLAGRTRPRVYLEVSSTGRGVFGIPRPDSYTADAVRLAGGALAFPVLHGPAQVSGEAVLRAEPDVILLAGTAAQAEALTRRPGWEGLRAVREGRVHAVPRALLLIPGPRVVEGVEHLAPLLHRHAFA
ncbi:ABC transporter substrate-binding protein [Teichococcus aestuarii]|uniref:Fe3+-hydroxamate ABC transporter substrate-binding protein n=1 Tax=Teichococcus aestuarii TaxID=568898 RepID=A0A2U1UYE7_9PROT|nr:ABC transporter substrate-binding protein [Pseudoroseomonas aestuarii]PWC26670.1 Fe3+-hydroxamate ABC transporter substrate-binding protein [Pseudoroseomonas aestuarii]